VDGLSAEELQGQQGEPATQGRKPAWDVVQYQNYVTGDDAFAAPGGPKSGGRGAGKVTAGPISERAPIPLDHKVWEGWIKVRDLGGGEGITRSPTTVRTDKVPKVHFSATLGEEPEVEVGLV
jgi:hypothetical protein